jgi:hypothetical protein
MEQVKQCSGSCDELCHMKTVKFNWKVVFCDRAQTTLIVTCKLRSPEKGWVNNWTTIATYL